MAGRILLLRHGETFSNREGRLDSAPPGAELTQRGRRQAVEAAHDLAAELGVRKGSVGSLRRIVCSVAIRAGQTAMTVARELESIAEMPYRSLPVETVAGIQEIFLGDSENHVDSEAYENYLVALKGWLVGDVDAGVSNGETLRDVVQRYRPVLERLAAEVSGTDQDILMVSHGAAMRVMATLAGGVDPAWSWNHRVENCTTIVFAPQGRPFGQWPITRWSIAQGAIPLLAAGHKSSG